MLSQLRHLAFVAAALASSTTTAQPTILDAQVHPSNGKTYALLSQSTWPSARTTGVALGGQLATVRSLAENTFIYTTFSSLGGVNRNLWIGLHDLDPTVNSTIRTTRRTEFGWVSGESVTYSNWSPVEPNNPNSPEPGTWEFYVHIWHPGDPNRQTWNNSLDGNTVNGVPAFGVVEVCSASTAIGAIICPTPPADATLASTTVGLGPLSRRWQIESPQDSGTFVAFGPAPFVEGATGLSLTDPGASATTDTLSPHVVSLGTHSTFIRFRLAVTNGCGTAFSLPVALSICAADFNCSGGPPTVSDIFAFLTAWFVGSASADFNGAGGVTVADIFAFLTAWFAGC